MAWTISIFDHLIICPSSVTLTFNLPEELFQTAHLLLKDNNCATLFCNPCINVQAIVRTSSIYGHFIICLVLPGSSTYMNKCFKWQSRTTNVPIYFELYGQMYKLWSGQTRQTDARMHSHRTEIVTAMFRSPQAGSTKMFLD